MFNILKLVTVGTSRAVQWLRLCASTAGGMGSIPGWETKTPHVVWHGQNKNKNKPVTVIYLIKRIKEKKSHTIVSKDTENVHDEIQFLFT